MLESALAALLRKHIRERGGMVVQLAPTVVGVPDRLVLLAGNMHLVELKTNTGRLSPAQVVWHARAAAAGVTVVVLRGREEVVSWTTSVL